MRKFIQENELLTWKFAMFMLAFLGLLALFAFFYLH